MDDTFARIGAAFHHLLAQSSVNGPAREEVKRLADELQGLELHINDIVNERVAAAVEGIEGRIMAHVDGNFTKLAEVLEASEIDFTPNDPPPPVVIAPAPDPAPEPDPVVQADAPPVPTTGNIPATPPAEAEVTADPAPADAPAEPATPPAEVTEPPAQETPAAPAEAAPSEGDPNTPANPEPAVGADGVDLTSDPEQMTVAQATQWLDDHQIDHDGVTLRDDLRALVAKTQAAAAPQATGTADTTIMVGDGKSDLTE